MRAVILLCALAGCTGAMNEYFAQDVVDTERDIDYIGDGNPRQYLDFYSPRGAERVPVVVFIHGGFWMRQDKHYYGPVTGLYANVGIALARQGIATAVINYGLVPSVTFEEQFADVAHAIEWVQRNAARYGGDPQHIVIAGHSAGGHLTALLAFDTKRRELLGVDATTLRGFAPISPIFDVPALAASSPEDAETVRIVFGDDPEEDSPDTYFSADAAPLLVMLGEDDLRSLKAQVPRAVTTLERMGADVRYHELAGKDHDEVVLDFDSDGDAMTPLLADFVREVAP
jgi:acetyl esterase/lipase